LTREKGSLLTTPPVRKEIKGGEGETVAGISCSREKLEGERGRKSSGGSDLWTKKINHPRGDQGGMSRREQGRKS